MSTMQTKDVSGVSFRHFAVNLVWMYVLAGVGLLIPLLTIPYLARVLRPDAWGRVLCAQAIGTLLVTVVEYGFNLSGTRNLSHAVTDRERQLDTVSDIVSAKLVCSLVVSLLGFMIYALMPIFHGHELVLGMAVLWGIVGGLNFGWYFQGTRRPALALTIDVAARVAGAVAIISLVQSPADDWIVIGVNFATAVLALAVTFPIVNREVGQLKLSLSGGYSSIKEAGPLASYVLCAGLRNSSSRIILGFLSSPAVVAVYGNAERFTDLIVRASEPASRIIYPLQCENAASGRSDASRTFARASLLLGGFTCALSCCVMVFAEPIIQLFFGRGYAQSVSVLRVLSVYPVLKVSTMMLNTFWALPHGLDRHMTPGVVQASVVGVVAAVTLVPHYSAIGMAVASLLSESAFLAWSVGYITLSGKLPCRSPSTSPMNTDTAATRLLPEVRACRTSQLAMEDATGRGK